MTLTRMCDSPILGSMDEAIEKLRKRHSALIDGLNELYTTLIEMRYLRPDEVVYPPYGVSGKPSLAKTQLQAAGFVPEVLEVMGMLPYPSNKALATWSVQEQGVPIAPDSGAISYLEGHEFDRTIETSRQPFRDGETGIPAWCFKLTYGGRDWGTTYIYDTRDTTMKRWDSLSDSADYWGQPSRGTEMALRILRNEMLSLDWIPWRDDREGFQTLGIHPRPSLLAGVGAANRFEECENELETLAEERAKYKRRIAEAQRTDTALNQAVTTERKRSGTLDLDSLKQLAKYHGIDLGAGRLRRLQPDGWGIGFVLDEIERNAPNDQTLRQKVLSMRQASAQQLREAAIEHGVSIAEIPTPPPPPPPQTGNDMKLEVAKAAQNIFACKRMLFKQCGWPEIFQGNAFEERRLEYEDEFHAFFVLLGPRAQDIRDPEEGAWLREWHRNKAGNMAV